MNANKPYTTTIPVRIYTSDSLTNYLAHSQDMEAREVAEVERIHKIAKMTLDPAFSDNHKLNVVCSDPWDISNYDIMESRRWVLEVLKEHFRKRA